MGRIAIAHNLGIQPPGDHPWESITVHDILENEAYIGNIVFGKRKYTKDSSGRKHISIRPRDEWIIVEHAHEPIIDLELWNKVQQVNASNAYHTKNDLQLKNPLAGVVRCGVCGKTLIRRNHHGRTRAMYLCNIYRCPTRMTRFEFVEERLMEQLSHIAKNSPSEDIMLQEEVHQSEVDSLQKQLAKAEEKTQRIAEQKDKLHDLLEQEVYDVATFLEQSNKLTDASTNLTRTIQTLREEIDKAEAQDKRRENILPALSHFVEEYNRCSSADAKNQLLKAIVEEVRYYRHKDWPFDRPFELEIYLRV